MNSSMVSLLENAANAANIVAIIVAISATVCVALLLFKFK